MKKNRLFSLILLVTMFFSLYTQSEVAAEDSAAAFDVVTFDYCNADNSTITDFTNFTANQVIKAKANIKNTGAASGDVTLILLAYQNGKLIKFASDKLTLAAGADDDALAQITLPATPAGCTVQTYFWSDILNMEALSKPAEFGSDNANLEYAVVGGKKVTFDENGIGTVVLPASSNGTPTVEVSAEDISTKFSTSYEDGKITITTSSTGGATKAYVINYTKAEPSLTNLSFWDEYIDATYTDSSENINSKLTNGIVKPNLVAEDFYDDATGDYTKTIKDVYDVDVYTGLKDYVNSSYSNKVPYWFYMDLPERFVGMNYIMVPYTNPGTVYSAKDTITFTTNKSVRFYVSANESWKDANGTHVGTYAFNQLRLGDTTAATTSYKVMKETSQSANHTFENRMYYYDVIVPAGQESVTATLKVQSAGTWDFPHIFYEFIEEDAEMPFIDVPLEVTSVTIKGLAADGSEAVAPQEYGLAPSSTLLVPNFTVRDDGNYYAAPQGTAGGTFWSSYLTRCNVDTYPYFHKFPSEMEGGYAYFWKNAFGINNTMTPVATFTINRDATLYFSSNATNVASYPAIADATLMDEDLITRNTSTWNCADSYYITAEQFAGTDTTGESVFHPDGLYKLELEVPQGQRTATFAIPLAWGGASTGHHPVMFIKQK
ncbi:MAG: hypothetical protein IJN62_06020 [Clostridia bacterium]|nr:hypothetical protein [Clostridia bacterium]